MMTILARLSSSEHESIFTHVVNFVVPTQIFSTKKRKLLPAVSSANIRHRTHYFTSTQSASERRYTSSHIQRSTPIKALQGSLFKIRAPLIVSSWIQIEKIDPYCYNVIALESRQCFHICRLSPSNNPFCGHTVAAGS